MKLGIITSQALQWTQNDHIPQKAFQCLQIMSSTEKKSDRKLGVLILKKWKVHTNTAKSKGLGILSKPKKKTLTSSWCATYLHMVGIIQGVFVFFIGVKYMDLSLGCLHHTLGLQLSWVFLFTSRGKGVLSRESLV